MHTMIVRMTLDPARLPEVNRHFEQDVVPWARRQDGFVGGRWLRSADGRQGLGIVVFDSAQAASAAAAGPRGQQPDDTRAWNVAEVVVFEQVAQA
jgi:hypothetical protein